jgi:hypothetical protein
MAALPPLESLEFARFKTLTGPAAQRVDFEVHFNPESLQHTVQNTLKEEGKGAKKKQHVSQTTAKLSMQLVFDTTDTGEDVRRYTDEVAKLMKPAGRGNERVPPLVEFGWGVYRFTGLVEQYQEKIDFFAAGGVPLRATVDLTMASQDVSFDSNLNPSASVDSDLGTPEAAVFLRGGIGLSAGIGGAAGLAVSLGDPRSARAIASLNGSASLRFDTSAELAVGGGVSLEGPAAFASGGAGIGIGGGIGASAGAGVGIGGSVGASAGASGGIGFGAGVGGSAGAGFGASAGAGISAGASAGIGGRANAGPGGAAGGGARIGAGAGATGGAFAGLRAAPGGARSVPDGRALFGAAANVSTGAKTPFAPGGRAAAQGGASLSADVGAASNPELKLRIR